MRIAHFDTGREWRGGQAQVLHLIRGLRDRGHESVVFAPAAALAERARAEGFATEIWRPLLEWDPAAIVAAVRGLGRYGSELVHCHTARAHGSAAAAGRWAGLPVVVSRRVPLEVRPNPLSRMKYRTGVVRYLCVSRSVAEALRRSGIPERRIAVVPSGVDLSTAAPDPPATGLCELIGAPAGAPVVGTIASLTVEKDHATLLEAAPEVLARQPEVRFVWIGEGPCRAALERRLRQLGLERRVHLLGFRAEAPLLLRQFTLLALPSRFEGLGNAVLEAQAAGVPVVASAVGGVPELVADRENGRLVPPGEPRALAAALIEALEDQAARARWVERALRTVQGFGIGPMVERTLAEYRAVVAERTAARAGGGV